MRAGGVEIDEDEAHRDIGKDAEGGELGGSMIEGCKCSRMQKRVIWNSCEIMNVGVNMKQGRRVGATIQKMHEINECGWYSECGFTLI